VSNDLSFGFGIQVVQVCRASVLAPADVLQGSHVLANQRAAFLVVVDALAPIAVLQALAEDLSRLHLDELFANHELAVLQHGHRIGVGLGGVEVIRWCFLVELGVVALENHGGDGGDGHEKKRQGKAEEKRPSYGSSSAL